MPPTAPTGVVPLRVAPPGLLPRATPTAPVNPAATLPKASSARTFTAGLIWWFATVVPGSVPNTSSVAVPAVIVRSEEHTSELQSQSNLVCRLLLEKKKYYPDGRAYRTTAASYCGGRRRGAVCPT